MALLGSVLAGHRLQRLMADRIEAGRPEPQFGEPNVHVACGDDDVAAVQLRRVVDADSTGTVTDLNLERPRA